MEDENIKRFGNPEYVLSDNDPRFDGMSVKDFSDIHCINCKHTETYNPKRNGISKTMVGTIIDDEVSKSSMGGMLR